MAGDLGSDLSLVGNGTAPGSSDPELIYTLLGGSASLSILGSLFIIVSWLLFTDMHFFSRKLIVYISITDMLASAAFLFAAIYRVGGTEDSKSPDGSVSLACTVQGFTLQFFVLASYLWTSCFAYHLHSLISYRRHKSGVSPVARLERYYHAISWGIPLVISAVLVAEKFLLKSNVVGGADRPWCWLTNHSSQSESYQLGMFQEFLFFYVPAVIVFTYNVSIYVVLARRVHGTELGANIRKRVLLYLVVFLVCSVWGLAHRIYQLFSPGHRPLKILSMVEAIFGPLQGFLNALVYGVSAKVISRYRNLCASCCSRSSADGDYISESVSAEARTPHRARHASGDTYVRDDRSSTDYRYSRGPSDLTQPLHDPVMAAEGVQQPRSDQAYWDASVRSDQGIFTSGPGRV